MRRNIISKSGRLLTIAGLFGLGLGACGDDQESPAATEASGDPSSGTESEGYTDTEASTGTTEGTGGTSDTSESDGADTGEPDGMGDAEKLCDAGDEAWVKQAIPLIQGRKPEGMREVRLLVSMIEQIDASGGDGREVVARGLASGDAYIDRWYDVFFEQLRINRIEIKANYGCYGVRSSAADDGDLAAFIRDNDPTGPGFDSSFSVRDVIESSLRLDDITPAYRADLFARMARPLQGANVSQTEIEIVRRANYGEIFETAYLGRRIGCLECHNSEESVTFNPDPEQNHFWAIPGKFERAIYGEAQGRPEAELYAAFRWSGFVVENGGTRPWGMNSSCGNFAEGYNGDLLGDPAYLGGELPAAAQLFDIDPLFKDGLKSIADSGLVTGRDLAVEADQALAFLLAVNITNNVWKEMMGYPLTLAHSFPRNAKQLEILQELSELFIAERFSVRELLVAIATHPYFNQDSPDACGASSAYNLQPVWDPFSVTSGDPTARLNSVGDRVQRYSAWVLVDSAARTMWWDRPQRIGDGGIPAYGFLRDQGIFVKDALPGFNGVDLGSLLSWENRLAKGKSPNLGGACTGPLGGECADFEWIELMLNEGAGQGATIRDAAIAIKDRLITEPELAGAAEEAVIADLFGVELDAGIGEADAGLVEAGARRYAGLLLNTPQFMLAGVPSRDQDPAADPSIVVAGTGTVELCEVLAPAILGDFTWSCAADGVKLE